MMVIHDVKYDNKYNQFLQNYSQEPSIFFKYDYVLNSLLIMLGSWKLAYN